jgi:hypothetical protein
MIAATVRRSWRSGTLACGWQASISGASAAQRSFVSMARLRKSELNAPAEDSAPTGVGALTQANLKLTHYRKEL